MLNKLPDRSPDLDELLSGECQTCHHRIEVKRWEAVPARTLLSSKRGEGTFDDTPYCECPVCKEGSLHGVGPRVYLHPKPKAQV